MSPLLPFLSPEAVASHLWQSTIFGGVTLAALRMGRRLPAGFRRGLAGIALARFALPLGLLSEIFAKATRPASLMPMPVFVPASLAARTWTFTVPVAAPVAHQGWAWIELLWAAGAAGLFGWWLARAWRFQNRLLASAEPLSPALQRSVRAAARKLRLRAVPTSVAVGEGTGPGVLGPFFPVLVLPAGLERALSPEELELVLMHELIHLRRRDPWWNFLQVLMACAFWFNPIAWLLHRSLRADCEHSCDDEVLRRLDRPRSYAAGIVKSVRFSLGLWQPGLAEAAAPPIQARLEAILSHRSRPRRAWLGAAVLGAGMAGLFLSGRAGAAAGSRQGASAGRGAFGDARQRTHPGMGQAGGPIGAGPGGRHECESAGILSRSCRGGPGRSGRL